MNRRSFIGASLGLGAAVTLAACGANSSSPGPGGGEPKPGGTLRIGALGQASNVVSDPFGLLANDSDMLIMSLVYDPLTVPAKSPNVTGRLAASWTTDAKQQAWTFTLPEAATFHDGSPVRPADVAWSLKTLGEMTPWKVPVDLNSIVPSGARSVTMRAPTPNSQLPLLLRLMTFTVKEGSTDRSDFIGTGPFRMEPGSYRDGNATLVRNDTWHGDKPLLDRIVVTRFESTDALANAIMGGEIDVASSAGPLAARTASARPDLILVRRPNDLSMPIAIRTSDGPFTDPRVREAIRLGIDRRAMIEQVLSGYGSVGNDVLGTGDPTYVDRPQRARDVTRARRLLAEARFDTARTYPLITKREVFNEVEAAQLFAAQLQDIGLKIAVEVKESADFYDNYWAKPSAPLATASWPTNDSVMFFASKVLNSESTSNETAFKDPQFDAAYRAGLAAAPDSADYRDASTNLQQIQFDRGGYVLWGMADGIDVARSNVRGLPELPGWGRAQLENTWLET
ncbi:ABC transporter substrate-binding protein [Mycolicibacterium wolinskyi]|uniref:ABC transporter substrate-binding protein n=1 Tax=Mycolicibacterium wolinskyi TaxID=59750 RepID=A0A132PRQ2_9MYCO|nr:ABC transporter substrate-binding protein [Mycolicibacterium wolinskyi]